MREKLKKEIYNIFSTYNLSIYNFNTVYITTNSNEITLDNLLKLSELLGTKDINFTGNKEEYALSEVSYNTEYEGTIVASNCTYNFNE